MSPRIDISQIQKAALKSLPLTFRLTSLVRDSNVLMDRILEAYLTELGQEKILEPLSYCLKELIVNAQKANTKRVYFEENGLDISNPEHYEKGMLEFHTRISGNLRHWVSALKEKGYSIGVTFHTTGGSLAITVRNNAELTPKEQTRIYDRIARARAYNSFVEALASPIDPTEGAGLGIMILLQFLKRMGIGEEAFSIESTQKQTVATLQIPMNKIHMAKLTVLTEAIARDVDSLPHFPENVLAIIKLTEDRNASLTKIANRIAMDPSLTADILKLVNSAHYMLRTKVKNIPQAVKLVGTRMLRNLLYTYSSQKILEEKYSEMKSLWEHSHRTAIYAYLLARSFRRKSDILDDVYVSGILHDLGQIIVSYLHPDAMERMTRFCKEKDISPRILERFSFGLNHGDIGALIAMKWNFPVPLQHGIKFHHDPLAAPIAHKDVVFCVYLANALCDLERGYLTHEQLEKPVLGEFGIRDEQQFRTVHESMRKTYEEKMRDRT